MMKLSKCSVLAGACFIVFALMSTIAAAQDLSAVKKNGPLLLGEYGNFFIPGTLATCPTPPPPATNSQLCSGTVNPGLHMINQMYVQFMKPQAQTAKSKYQSPSCTAAA